MTLNPEEIADRHLHAADAAFERTRSGLCTRRSLLRAGAAGAATLLASPAAANISALMCPPEAGSFGGQASGATAPAGASAVDEDYSGSVPDDGPGMRRLRMTNAHTSDVFDRNIVENGEFVPEAIEEFSQFARDWRRNDAKAYDPRTPQIIWDVWRRLGMDSPFALNSGYRSPATNAAIGGAQNSYHMRAKACDISTSARSVPQVHAAASANQQGGLGKYTSSGFVHVDSGPVRNWGI